MNKHFEDTTYYLKRAGETAKAGLAEELSGIEARVRELAGREEEEEIAEASRVDELKADLKDLQARAEGDAREAIAEARERLDEYRAQEA